MDSKLAEPCPPLSKPEAADFDAWQTWMEDEVLRAYGECAAKVRRIVEAWPK